MFKILSLSNGLSIFSISANWGLGIQKDTAPSLWEIGAPFDLPKFLVCCTSSCPEQLFYGHQPDPSPPLTPRGAPFLELGRPWGSRVGSDQVGAHRKVVQGIKKCNILNFEANRTERKLRAIGELGVPGGQGWARIGLVPIEKLFGASRSTTYQKFRQIERRANFP